MTSDRGDLISDLYHRALARAPEERPAFLREARTLATLNHPHMGAIYDLEEADGVSALVLELAEGQTLADRLERGPLPLAAAVACARQIAEALDAALALCSSSAAAISWRSASIPSTGRFSAS